MRLMRSLIILTSWCVSLPHIPRRDRCSSDCAIARAEQEGLTFKEITEQDDGDEFCIFKISGIRVKTLHVYATGEDEPTDDEIEHLDMLRLKELRAFMSAGKMKWSCDIPMCT